MVLEDLTQPPGQRLAAFGMSVFVTPAFMASAKRGSVPGLAAEVARAILAGETSVLETEAVRRANSGLGLNLLVLHYAEAPRDPTPERLGEVRAKQVETFFFVHGGYRFAKMLVEHRDDHLRQFSLEGGFEIRSEYDSYFHGSPRPPSPRPILLGITREETLPHPGWHVARLFLYTPPRFHFKPQEQALLWRALLDETDDEIAAALFLSVNTVKKRWTGIYERVTNIAPALLFPEPPDTTPNEPRRGLEKRRHLLRYLRLYPEELRPTLPPAL